jgi:uncharacterized protein
MVKEVIFSGENGRLEGKYYHSEVPGAPIALVIHPHPLHGGTMDNEIVYNLFHIFVQQGFSVLRFNFRGVGKSTGIFDHGVGELMDAADALDWLQTRSPEASRCWIAGFAFGSWISFQLLMRRPEISGFVCVAPSVEAYDFGFLSSCPIRGLIVQGSEDKITPEPSVYRLYETLDKQRHSDVEYGLIYGAGHKFDGKIDNFKTLISQYISAHLSYDIMPKKAKRDRRKRQSSLLKM